MRHASSLVILTLSVAAALASTGCSPAAPSASVSPSASILSVKEQIAATKAGLTEALTAYEAGENNKATEAVNDAYLEHFEFVEGPLGQADAELSETLEDKIREDLRADIAAGRPAADIAALITEIQGLLDQALTKVP